MFAHRGSVVRPGRKRNLTRSRPGVEALEGRALLSGAGSLDPTFGSGGVAVHPIGPTAADPTDVAFQPDGKTVVVGNLVSQFVLARYNADGSPDTTFGKNGVVLRNDPPLGGSVTSETLLIQPDGKVVVALNQEAIPGGSGKNLATLFRFNPDGSADTTFGNGGAEGIPAAGIGGLAQDGNQLLYVGFGTLSNPATSIGRLNDDGSADTGFGTNGVVSTSLSPSEFVNAPALAVEPNGTIVLAGSVDLQGASGSAPVLETFSAAGRPVNHATFSLGAAYPNFDPSSVVIQPDGKIIVAGTVTSKFTSYDPVLARFTPGLSLDTGFGKNGLALWATGAGNAGAAVVVQPDGGIVVAGDGPVNAQGQSTSLVVARYQPNGAPDTTFGTRGTVTLANGAGPFQAPVGLGLGPNNTLLVAGNVAAGSGAPQVVLARLTGTPFATAAAPNPAVPPYVFQGLSVVAPARRGFTHPVADLVLPPGFPAADASLFARSVIAWGDGTLSLGTLAPFRGAYAVTGTHTYPRPGVYHTTIALLSASGVTTKVTQGTIVAR